ncbi:MAG: DUF3617 family protein [Gammaproteobacteria bacterium]
MNIESAWRLVAPLVLVAASQAALAVKVDPGLWEMSYEIRVPMVEQPQTRTVTECVATDRLTADDLTGDDRNPRTFENIEDSDERISWTMTCPSPSGATTGRWEFRSAGDVMTGEGSMAMDVPGMKMEMAMSMTGRRVGDCEEQARGRGSPPTAAQ